MKLYRKKFFNIDISFRIGVRRDSENLRYNAKKNTIHPRYNRAVANLARAINQMFLK